MRISLLIGVVTGVWLVNETVKYVIRRRTEADARFGDSGGMPSSHAAVTASAAVAAGLEEGFDSTVFGLAVILTAIVAHDAVRLRGMVGRQALRLNELISASTLADKHPVYIWRGHRIREVAVGLVLGVVLGWFGYYALNVLFVMVP